MFPKIQPLPQHIEKFELLSEEEREIIVKVQKKYPQYWWNPNCKTKCTSHKKVHKYNFESYVEGFVTGYFGTDSISKMLEWITGE